MSKLFQLAKQAAQSAFGSRRNARSARSRTRDQKTGRLIDQLATATADGNSYSATAASLAGELLDTLGPLGDVIRSAVGATRRGALGSRQLMTALDLLGIFRGRGKPRRPTELPLSEEVGKRLEEIVSPRRSVPPGEPLPPPLPSGGQRPPPAPPSVGGGYDDDEPPEHDIELSGRGSIGYDQAGTERLIGREIRTPGSSNVYSFVYEPENAASGILYVTFKAWYPGMKGKRPNSAGPTYAYYDVPLRRYKAFASMAATTAGGAVWDFLRVRGSKWDHRFPYRLVAGVLVPAGGEYVPRKATRRGMKKRSLPRQGTGRRGFASSTLPESVYDASPDRGRPDRGTPNRGRL